jgi:hypothetical protein
MNTLKQMLPGNGIKRYFSDIGVEYLGKTYHTYKESFRRISVGNRPRKPGPRPYDLRLGPVKARLWEAGTKARSRVRPATALPRGDRRPNAVTSC